MEGKGFEVLVKDENDKVVVDRHVNDIRNGEGWAKWYSEQGRGDATFYIDGKAQVTYHSQSEK